MTTLSTSYVPAISAAPRRHVGLLVKSGGVLFLLAYGLFPTGFFPAAPRVFGFPDAAIPYSDSTVIVYGSDELAQGRDPLVSNPKDPWGRPLNYPRVVGQIAQGMGLGLGDDALLGRTFVLIFIVGVIALLAPLPAGSALGVALLLFSPPVMFALERGNLDLLVFGLLATTCFAAPLLLLSVVLPLLCAVKIYPAFALPAGWLLARGRARFVWLAAALACVAYGWFIFPDLRLIRAATPHWHESSWGVSTLGIFRAGLFPAWAPWFLALGVVATGLLAGLRSPLHDPARAARPRLLLAALCGAMIYLGAYFLGTNFNYRLIFLLLAAPFLLCEGFAASPVAGQGRARLALALILLTFWADPLHLLLLPVVPGVWLLDELAPLLTLFPCAWLVGRNLHHLPLPASVQRQLSP